MIPKIMAFDQQDEKYLPACDPYEMVPATEAGKTPRRTVKPVSFVMLVCSKIEP